MCPFHGTESNLSFFDFHRLFDSSWGIGDPWSRNPLPPCLPSTVPTWHVVTFNHHLPHWQIPSYRHLGQLVESGGYNRLGGGDLAQGPAYVKENQILDATSKCQLYFSFLPSLFIWDFYFYFQKGIRLEPVAFRLPDHMFEFVSFPFTLRSVFYWQPHSRRGLFVILHRSQGWDKDVIPAFQLWNWSREDESGFDGWVGFTFWVCPRFSALY